MISLGLAVVVLLAVFVVAMVGLGLSGVGRPRLLAVLATVGVVALCAVVFDLIANHGPSVSPILAAGQSCSDLLPQYPGSSPAPVSEPNYNAFVCHLEFTTADKAPAVAAFEATTNATSRWRPSATQTAAGWFEFTRRDRPQLRARVVVMATGAGSLIVEDAFVDCATLSSGPFGTSCGPPVNPPGGSPSQDACGMPVDGEMMGGWGGGGALCRGSYTTRESVSSVLAFYKASLKSDPWRVDSAPAGSGLMFISSAGNAGYVIVDRVASITLVTFEMGPQTGCPCSAPG